MKLVDIVAQIDFQKILQATDSTAELETELIRITAEFSDVADQVLDLLEGREVFPHVTSGVATADEIFIWMAATSYMQYANIFAHNGLEDPECELLPQDEETSREQAAITGLKFGVALSWLYCNKKADSKIYLREIDFNKEVRKMDIGDLDMHSSPFLSFFDGALTEIEKQWEYLDAEVDVAGLDDIEATFVEMMAATINKIDTLPTGEYFDLFQIHVIVSAVMVWVKEQINKQLGN